MTRYDELSRKAESLWYAASVCDDIAMMAVWLKKIHDLKAMMRGLSIDQSEQSATDRRNHVLSAVGLRIVSTDEHGGIDVLHPQSNVSTKYPIRSVYDSCTGLPVTWGELIERMNGR